MVKKKKNKPKLWKHWAGSSVLTLLLSVGGGWATMSATDTIVLTKEEQAVLMNTFNQMQMAIDKLQKRCQVA